MLIRDVEMFIEHCENKGLATKTIGSYEQTLRLLMLYLDEQGITQTEKITHTVIQNYVRQIKERGKYTVTSNPNSGNYQERRLDFGKKVSDVTINNYLRNMSAFFGWCVEEDLILRSPVKRGDYIKVERRPLEFVSDEDFRKLLRNMNTASFSEYRDSIVIQLLLDVREGDTVYIHDFSRLARSTKDLLAIVDQLQEKGVHLVSNKENLDTSTSNGRLMLTMIAAINEFERENLLERQREGIAIAKAEGKFKGGQVKRIDDKTFCAAYDRYQHRELNKTQLAAELRISRPTLNKLLKDKGLS